MGPVKKNLATWPNSIPHTHPMGDMPSGGPQKMMQQFPERPSSGTENHDPFPPRACDWGSTFCKHTTTTNIQCSVGTKEICHPVPGFSTLTFHSKTESCDRCQWSNAFHQLGKAQNPGPAKLCNGGHKHHLRMQMLYQAIWASLIAQMLILPLQVWWSEVPIESKKCNLKVHECTCITWRRMQAWQQCWVPAKCCQAKIFCTWFALHMHEH